MGPEAVIETTICDEARADGWKAWKLTFIGVRGAPDRAFGKAGQTILIEFKRKDEEPTKQQLRRHQELRDYFGFNVFWVDNATDARRILKLREP